MVEKKTNRALEFLELPVDRGACLPHITILIVTSLWLLISQRPKQVEGPMKMSLRESLSGPCTQRKAADKRTERRQWGWNGEEAEGEMDHRRLEESLPILGPPLPKGAGPWGLGCHMEMWLPVPLLTLGYVESVVVKGAYIWWDIDRHLNAATWEALKSHRGIIVRIKKYCIIKWLDNKCFLLLFLHKHSFPFPS